MCPLILISGDYNVFKTGFNCAGSYMCSGLYQSYSFKLPIYIGGSENIQHRIEYNHLPELKKNEHDNFPFQFSWNKHNEKEGFVWWLLEKSTIGESLLIEQKYLNLYRPFVDEKGGFNISHNALSPMLGKRHSLETIKEIQEKQPKLFGKDNPMYGKKGYFSGKQHSLETCKIIKGKRKLQDMSFCHKSIRQLDLNGNLIKIWKSATHASQILKISRQNITVVCLNKRNRKIAGGFQWEYIL